MFKKIALVLGLLGSVLMFTGCTTANTTRDDKMLDVSRVEKFVNKGATTLGEVRELIGTPGIAGRTIDGKDFVGFAIVGQRSAADEAGKFAASVLTLGIVNDDEYKYIQKNIFFVLDDNKVVQDIKYHGYAYMNKTKAFSIVVNCQRELTDQELRDTTNYSKDYIIKTWKDYVLEQRPADVVAIAQKENTPLEKLDYEDIEYNSVGIPTHLQMSAHKLFGDYTNEELNSVSGRQDKDGSKKALLGL